MIPFSYPARFRHIYVPGGTGMGKTNELLCMAIQDIRNGAGITVLDPKGDLVEDLLHFIPERRVDDTYYITLDHPIPFDFLSFDGETEKDELVDDLVFLLLGDAGNAPRAKGILTDALYAILGSEEPTTFLDIAHFLTDKRRREQILQKLNDYELKRQWKKVPSDEKLEPIISRLTKYRRNSVLKKAFGSKPIFTIADIMNKRQILLVKLGGGSRVAIDYGSLLFMKMKQEVFRRHKMAHRDRIPHFLFVDEFQKFAHVEDFEDVLMMARGYKLAMTLANPVYHRLPENIKAGLGIIGTYICFALDPQDVSFFKSIYDFDNPAHLSNLPKYKAYYKMRGRPGRIKPSAPVPNRPPISFAETIKARFAENGTNQPSTGQNPDVLQDDKDGDPSNTAEQDIPSYTRQDKRGRRAR